PVEYRNTQFIYKTVAEVWLDMLRHEYLTELGRSPLERGLVLSHRTQLRTCFAAPTSGAVAVRSAQSTRPPIARVPFRPTPSYAQPVRRNRASAFDEPRPSETVTRWNTLHAELIRQVSKLPSEGQESLSFASPAMVQLFLRSWAALPEHDPRNVAIQNLASILAL